MIFYLYNPRNNNRYVIEAEYNNLEEKAQGVFKLFKESDRNIDNYELYEMHRTYLKQNNKIEFNF